MGSIYDEVDREANADRRNYEYEPERPDRDDYSEKSDSMRNFGLRSQRSDRVARQYESDNADTGQVPSPDPTSMDSNAYPSPNLKSSYEELADAQFTPSDWQNERLGAVHRIITGRPLDASTQDTPVAKRLRAGGSPGQMRDVERPFDGSFQRRLMEQYGPNMEGMSRTASPYAYIKPEEDR